MSDKEPLKQLLGYAKRHFIEQHPDKDMTQPCSFMDDLEDEILDWHQQELAEAINKKYKGAWGLTSLLDVANALEVAENGGDVKECSDAMNAILKEMGVIKKKEGNLYIWNK